MIPSIFWAMRSRDKLLFLSGSFIVPVSLVAPRGMVIIAPVLFLTFLILNRKSLQVREFRRFTGFVECVCLVVLAFLSLLWVAEPSAALKKLGPLSILIGAGLGLLYCIWKSEPNVLRPFLLGFVSGMVVAAAYFLIEVMSGGMIIRTIRGHRWAFDEYFMTFREFGVLALNRGTTMMSLLIWPTAGYLAFIGHKRSAIASVIAVFVLILFASPATPILGMLFGMIIFSLTYCRPVFVTTALAVVFSVGILTAPLLQKVLPDAATAAREQTYIPSSGVLRLAIWEHTVDLLEKKSLLGWGFLSSRMFYDPSDSEPTVMTNRGSEDTYKAPLEPIPLHPHNAILQWWLELGFLGALIFSIFTYRFLRALASFSDQIPRYISSSVSACYLSAMVSLSLSYGAWQTWWLSGLVITGAISLALIKYVKGMDHNKRHYS